MRSCDASLIFPVALKMTYFCGACRLFHPTSQVTTTPNLMVCTLVEPSVARPTHTGEDCNEPWRELGAAGSGAGVSSRVSRARSPPARLNHFARNFEEKRVQKIAHRYHRVQNTRIMKVGYKLHIFYSPLPRSSFWLIPGPFSGEILINFSFL